MEEIRLPKAVHNYSVREKTDYRKNVFAVVLSQNRPVAYPVRIMTTSKGKVSISLVKSSQESLHLASMGYSVHASL
jgi:hypothetical protein